MISSVMISCDARTTIREQTLKDLSETDWDWPIKLIIDKDYISSIEYDRVDSRQRQTIASLEAIKVALSLNSKYVVFMEDDLIFNKFIKHNILNWMPIKNEILNFGSLYTPNNNRCSIEDGKNWYIADCLKLYGSQFFIMSRLAAQWSIDHWNKIEGMQDIKLTRLARGKPIYYYDPSLVQHRETPSVWGGISHKSADFDEYWKHPI
jgi:hypothetical protein